MVKELMVIGYVLKLQGLKIKGLGSKGDMRDARGQRKVLSAKSGKQMR